MKTNNKYGNLKHSRQYELTCNKYDKRKARNINQYYCKFVYFCITDDKKTRLNFSNCD